jgi:endoglycosylceramidase
VVRLVFLWEAYEPEPGCYDERYLATVRSIVEAAWERGMYVIIDIHQDGFSRHASRGSGSGFPRWAVSRRGRASTPDNSPRCKNWAVMMASDPTTHMSFIDFFADAHGVRSRYLAMLARIAATFAQTPGVIGYDLMNEPWGDEARDLAPLYRDAASAIRAQHPAAILFLEGHITTNSGIQTKLPRPGYGNVVYAPHYYRPLTIVLKRWHGSCVSIDRAFGRMASKAEEWDVPLFVGEFGVGAEARGAGGYVAALYDRLDAQLASSTQWNYTPGWTAANKDGWNGEDFNIIDPGGALRENFRPRPYPRVTAGIPVRFHYSARDKGNVGHSLEFVWRHDPDRGDTEIFLPRGLFPGTTTAEVQPSDVSVQRDESRQVLICSSPRATVITLRVSARSDGPAMTDFRSSPSFQMSR